MSEDRMKIAIQDTYGERFKHCWGCGSKNENGLHLKSYPGDEENTCVTEIVPDGQYTCVVFEFIFF